MQLRRVRHRREDLRPKRGQKAERDARRDVGVLRERFAHRWVAQPLRGQGDRLEERCRRGPPRRDVQHVALLDPRVSAEPLDDHGVRVVDQALQQAPVSLPRRGLAVPEAHRLGAHVLRDALVQLLEGARVEQVPADTVKLCASRREVHGLEREGVLLVGLVDELCERKEDLVGGAAAPHAVAEEPLQVGRRGVGVDGEEVSLKLAPTQGRLRHARDPPDEGRVLVLVAVGDHRHARGITGRRLRRPPARSSTLRHALRSRAALSRCRCRCPGRA